MAQYINKIYISRAKGAIPQCLPPPGANYATRLEQHRLLLFIRNINAPTRVLAKSKSASECFRFRFPEHAP